MKLSMCEGEMMAVKNAARQIEAMGGDGSLQAESTQS